MNVKQAAGTLVVAESEQGQPLIVTGEVGGRVVALAFDSTWRWWMYGHEEEHKRFWRQVVLWLVHREDLNQDEVWVRLAQRRFYPGARVAFTAGTSTAAGQPIAGASLQAELTDPDGKRVPLQLVQDGDHYRGAIDAVEQPGDYSITVTAGKNQQTLGISTGEFLVFDRDIELSQAAADHDQLARLAAQTQDAGGKLIAPEQLPALLEQLRDRPPELEIEVQTKWQLADTAQDAWTLLLTVVLLLTAEWFLRKKWGLV